MKQSIICLINLLLAILLTACSTTHFNDVDSAPLFAGTVDHLPNAVPKAEPLSRYGNPECYNVDGRKYYVLKTARGYCKTGLASWYGTKFHGRSTSSREPYNMFAMTAASTNLPIPTYVEVTNLENGKKIIVKVNDRGPFKSDRLIDLSYAAALKLGFANKGTAQVQVRAIDPQNLNNKKIAQEIKLANNSETPEIQIHLPALPAPYQTTQPITLERYIQLGAFANRDNAIRLQGKIATYTHAKVLIKEGKSNNKIIYRVQIGPFKEAREADALLHLLKEQGYQDAITVFS